MNACVISTFRCNAKCHMCNIWANPTKKEEEISVDILKKLPSNLGRINLTGGEPMIREDIEDLVAVLYNKCKLLEISTNGFYTERIVNIAKKYPKVMIRVSLEGLPELNDRLRGTHNGFDHALRTILELKKTNIKNYGFSVVICDKNVKDLITIYELSCELGVEFGTSTMHNSWYFHKYDNKINDLDLIVNKEKEFIRAMLGSRRRNINLRIKDWLRAYFNLNILQHLQGSDNLLANCCAGSDLFFVDPLGNVLPCNGSNDKWIMGNLYEDSFDKIWKSSKADEIRKKIASCRKECAFIGTARFDMKRRPWRPLIWIASNKLKIYLNKDIDYLSDK